MIGVILLAAAAAAPASDSLAALDRVVNDAIARKELPGAVVLVGHNKDIVFRKAFGNRALQPQPELMTVDTVFDLASLTKVVATAPSVLLLAEEGRLRLADPVVRYLPDFAAGGPERAKVTIEQLLTHRAGLPPDDPLSLYVGTPAEIFARMFREPLDSPPGSRFVYSDVGYEVLGEIVHRVCGETLDRFAARRIFQPLEMEDTGFRPIQPGGEPAAPPDVARIAPTEMRNGHWMRGEVHDPRAYALGGVAGHAGLFSTADDLARYCQMILGQGELGTVRVLSPLSVDAMTRPRDYGDADLRSLGFDVETAYSGPRGDLFPPGSFGHTGFTGTSLWIDPASQSYVILLSNRVHPDGKGDVLRLRALVSNVVAAAMRGDLRTRAREVEARLPRRMADVSAGIDVLAGDGFREIAGRRVGLVTNAAGRARDGRTTVEVLRSEAARKAGVALVRLFSPEHGLGAVADARVADGIDPSSGLPVRSLYGEGERPRPEDFAALDAVVFDLQDVGTRFYTYLATLGYVLEGAAKAKVPVIVLDRPDPIGGELVEGPLADPDQLSTTAYHSLPIRTGMTMGELARLFNGERSLRADVRVVRMRGWSRRLWYDETNLEWVNPSPNMRSLAAAALYPGMGLLETTNVSVGRGTDAPFELLGAPWIDGTRLARVLAARSLSGTRFSPVRFTPSSSVYAGQSCGGIRVDLVDREALRSVALGIEIAATLRDLYPADWQRDGFAKLLANRETFERLDRGDPPERIIVSWTKQLEEFEKVRRKYLLY
ncbi:MAG TPA: exo-beta-N-acetylmuramidase NamZ domain-containing protein [Thermoanaerobaculia bacterium]|nr:exo-beta-N-acetylmuramidase NamZ domain-containing protein [Thermoanaerobaculia bacterium]